MALKPLGDRLIVKPLDQESVTPGGIVLPDTAQEKQTRGTVIAVSDGVLSDDGSTRVPLEVVVGDEVYFQKYGGSDVTIDGDELLILREQDIIAKVEN